MEPDRDPEAMAYAVRTHLPLVQVPPGGSWSSGGSPAYTLAEWWLGRPLSGEREPRDLVLRYLAAFGPASVKDVQAWSGMVRLKGPVEELKPELRSFRDEHGNELLDVPHAPLPPADTPARFIPDYDNLILSHADRTQVIADEHRARVFLSAGRVRATFLLDGFVGGTWEIESAKERATLVIEPFEFLGVGDREALIEEGERLVRFVADDPEAFGIRFAD
jgi:hypothetical protein